MAVDCETETAPEVVSSKFARIFGLEDPTRDAVRYVKIISVLLPAFALSFQISTTFWMIHMAETLGGGDYFVGLTFVGVLVVIQLVDYPTGALGDAIGQRYVIASALLCYAIAFYLSSQIVIGTPFYVYIAIYALFGLGSSQESGAFSAWFDNNYKVAMPHDKDRKQYGVQSCHATRQGPKTVRSIPRSTRYGLAGVLDTCIDSWVLACMVIQPSICFWSSSYFCSVSSHSCSEACQGFAWS